MIAIVLIAAGTLAVGLLAALVLRRLPSLRWQLVGLALMAVILPLGAVMLSGAVMLDARDRLTLLAVAGCTSAASLAAALLLARSVIAGVDRMRATASALARGDLGARSPEDGPAELAELAGALNEMAARVEELFDARAQLVAWASHDLRTPLASLQAMLEAVEDGLVEPEHYLPAMRDQTRALGGLVDDLFEVARLDAGALTLEIGSWPLSGLVESCLRGLEAEALARRITLEARVQGSPAALCAPNEVQRVLLNLLTNALRHTPSDGSVAVAVEPEDERVRVSVEDTGEGLTAEARGRMFDRFWRGDRARMRGGGGGAGLGLAIARGLVEAQGGTIWAESRAGGGTRVSFTLPADAGAPSRVA